MKSKILYGSQYGTSKGYAEKLSELTGIEAVSYDKAKDTASYDRVIYVGGLYAGGVKGLKNTVKFLRPGTELIVATVGLADVNNPENTESIKQSLQKQMPGELYARARIFHLRGGIDYAKLNFKHRIMMGMLYKSVKQKPAGERTAEANELIETYNQKVDFVDYGTLEPIVDAVVQ